MVPYKTASSMLMDALNGTITMSSETKSPLVQHIAPGGLLKPIAVAWPTRLQELPNVPTWAELGMPNANIESWYGIILPAGASSEVVNILYTAMKQAAKDPELQEAIKNTGAYPRAVIAPDEFGKIIKQEAERHRKTVELGRVKLD
jgi:tripartite-type tricarboxylate transporter receptor subunit TctC